MITRKLFVLRGIIEKYLAKKLSRFRVFGNVKIGSGVKIYKGAYVYCDEESEIILENNVTLYKNVKIIAQFGDRIVVGTNTTVQEFGHLEGNISIGDNCIIAPRVYISTTSHTFNLKRGMLIRDQDASRTAKNTKTSIGSNCWIGLASVFLGEVLIKNNSVIGANSLLSNYSAASESLIIQNRRELIEQDINYKN